MRPLSDKWLLNGFRMSGNHVASSNGTEDTGRMQVVFNLAPAQALPIASQVVSSFAGTYLAACLAVRSLALRVAVHICNRT